MEGVGAAYDLLSYFCNLHMAAFQLFRDGGLAVDYPLAIRLFMRWRQLVMDAASVQVAVSNVGLWS